MRRTYPFTDEQHYLEDTPRQPTIFEDSKLENFKFVMECYKKYNAGIEYTLILVDNETTDPRALEYMKSLGLPIYHRENNGFSFGGYKFAWEMFGERFDYYLFHEQDHTPCKDGWLKELLDIYQADEEIGALGNVVEYREKDETKQALKDQFARIAPKRDFMYNLDGAFCFTSASVLKESGLKIIDGKINESTFNEILFVQPILEAGYKIASVGCRDFHKTSTIHFYGMRKGDLVRPFEPEKLAPIVESTTRFNCKQMKEYFNA